MAKKLNITGEFWQALLFKKMKISKWQFYHWEQNQLAESLLEKMAIILMTAIRKYLPDEL